MKAQFAVATLDPCSLPHEHRRQNVCIVTNECHGPWKNGGIGTSITGLAEVLSTAGHSVTILYTRGIWLTEPDVRHWKCIYAKRGINFVALRPADLRNLRGPAADLGLVIPSSVLQYVLAHSFDIIHLNDTEGDGFLVVAARRFGVALRSTLVVTALHSPRAWTQLLNRSMLAMHVSIAMDAAERISITYPDVLWCPSRYLINWVAENNFVLPPHVVQQQYVMPVRRSFDGVKQSNSSASSPSSTVVRTVVFFGRLEERKGLRLFLDALDQLTTLLEARGIDIVFLGRIAELARCRSDVVIAERAARWRFRWRIVSDLGQEQALCLLSQPHHLAVIASPADNSPCTVYEVLENKIPFIAARSGGIPELIHPEDSSDVLFDYTVGSLASTLEHAICSGPKSARPSLIRSENVKRWLAFHSEAKRWKREPELNQHVSQLVVVVQDSGYGVDCVNNTLASLEACSNRIHATVLLADSFRPVSLAKYPNVAALAVSDAEETFKNLLFGSSSAVLLVYAGVRIAGDVLEHMLRVLGTDGVEIFAPSASTDEGARIDALGCSPALSFSQGPAATGALLLGPSAVKKALAMPADVDAGPFGALADRAIVAGAVSAPFPEVLSTVFEANLRSFRPNMTESRIRLYAELRNRARIDLTLLAAMGGGSVSAFSNNRRAIAYRLLRSRLGSLTPWMVKFYDVVIAAFQQLRIRCQRLTANRPV